MKWLQSNPVGMALGVLCGFLLLVLLVLTVVSNLPLSLTLSDDEAGEAVPGLELPALADNLPLDAYNVITERPLFNDSRLPIIGDEAEGEDLALESDADFELPDVELSGVIITPTLRMVTLKRKDNEHSLVAFEGRPIEADFGTWQVTSVHPRAATLTSDSGEELQLEMKVHDEKIEQPKATAEQTREALQNTSVAAPKEAEIEPLSRAEEIRQRIAERREELRRQVEEGEQDPSQPEQINYKDAIQSMIRRKEPVKTNNEEQ